MRQQLFAKQEGLLENVIRQATFSSFAASLPCDNPTPNNHSIHLDAATLKQFREAVAGYERGPQTGINPQTGEPYVSTQWDILEYVEATGMRL
jgi:hypothetical protein